MTYFTHIRAGLISSVLLLTTALASPALAETLPEISPRQIASDVEVKFNPDTGAKEYIAPSFDPFEEDRTMAGTASLRSVSSATTIDGQSVRGGALLDMTFYYNSASNDPYDTRGYDDAVYLSGEFAPVIRRDNRILECNEQVQDVVYYHEDYYRPSIYVNLFRPYRHYSGHHRYDRFRDRGYAYGRGYRGTRGYGRHRGYGTSRGRVHNDRRRGDRSRSSTTDRIVDRAIDRARRTTTQREDRAATGRRMDRTPSARGANRAERRTNRADRSETRRNETRRTETRRGSRDGFLGGPRRLENNDGQRRERSRTRNATPRAERAPRTERATRNRNNSVAGAAARRAAPRAAAPAARQAPAPRVERSAPAPRAERPRTERKERSRPARAERNVNRARETKSNNTSRKSSGGFRGMKRGSKLKLMSVLPMASSWSRNAVRTVDVQCAREEMLTVHIPQERLDAARFDGLTVLVLDRTGQEIPVYVPANYIEGFRQAVDGRVTPSRSYQEPRSSAPVTREPIYQEPRPYSIESAPCPVGTTKQDDGTCLQGGTVTYGGYPTR